MVEDPYSESSESFRAAAFSTDSLRGAIAECARLVASKEALISEAQNELDAVRREHRLLTELLALRGELPVRAQGAVSDISPRSSEGSVYDESEPVADAAVLYLSEAGGPTHIGDIYRALLERNVEIPGAGDQANVILRLSNDRRIIRTSRGVYGLREWNLPEYKPKTRKKSSKPRKSARS